MIEKKKKNFSISDSGFLYIYPNYKKIQIYNGSTTPVEILMMEQYCINGQCLSKNRFIENFVSKYYYDEILEDIVDSSELKLELINKTNDLYNYKSINYDISYSPKKDNIEFFDRQNKILINIDKR
jgi:hypothetical protein